jgi:tetratricopeptide (TPR) repeat protein
MLYYFMAKGKSVAGKGGLNPDAHVMRWLDNLFHKRIVHLLLISVTGLLIYSNTLNSPFQWDETEFLIKNPIVRDLHYFAETSDAEGFPVYNGLITRYIGYLTFALNYRVHGFDVTGYHVVNLFIHISNSLLLYYLIILSFSTPFIAGNRLHTGDEESPRYPLFIALSTSLLFVVHPIQTEAVTYVFQRFASLVTLFYLLSLALYAKARMITDRAEKGESRVRDVEKKPALHTLGPLLLYLLSLVSVTLAMKTKENAFILPIIVVIYEFLFFRGQLKGRILRLLPYIITLLIIPVTFIGLVGSAGELISQVDDPLSLGYHDLSSSEYLFTQFRVITSYIRLIFLPIGQNLIHNFPVYRSFFEPVVIASFSFLLLIFCTGVYFTFRTQRSAESANKDLMRMTSFGIFWFYVTLSVESGIIPIFMVMNEYRVYLPSAGLFLALISCSLMIIRKLPATAAWKQGTSAALFCVVILFLAYATYARNSLWMDKVVLWQDVVRKNPASERGLNNLGTAYYEKGLYDSAIVQFKKVIRLNPAYTAAYINLGSAYATAGRPDLAVWYFKKATSLDRGNSLAFANLARSYRGTGKYDMAVENYYKAIALDPFHRASYLGLGESLKVLGRFDEAITVYSRLARISPDDAELYRKRGIVYEKTGDIKSAVRDFQRSCSLGSIMGCEYAKKKLAR